MVSRSSPTRWRVVLLAAARLATLYAVTTALLLAPLVLYLDGTREVLRDLREYATPIGVVFAVAFVLLAVARRIGFVALWLALAAGWAWVLRLIDPGYPSQLTDAFIGWSVVAVPLALLGGLGVPSVLHLRVGRFQVSAIALTGLLWAALLIPAIAVLVLPAFGAPLWQLVAMERLVADIGWFVWAPGAPLLVALSVAHVWSGTVPAKIASAAA